MNLRHSIYPAAFLIILVLGCTSSKPKTMLEYYYAIPFGDKYSETLTREQKEKLFKAGEWKVMEDSGYANLKSNIEDANYSEEISIRVWNEGDKVAVTTLYDEGSDCPPLSELSIYEYTRNGWKSIETPGIEVSDYWIDKKSVPEAVINNSSHIEFEPFLDQHSNGIRFEWRYYRCFSGDDEVPDYDELVSQRSFHIGSEQRDYDQVYVTWSQDLSTYNKSFPTGAREKSSKRNTDLIDQPGIGLLLGVGDDHTATHFITFVDDEISIKRLNGAILSPQQDDFYVIQPWSEVASRDCSYTENESEQEEKCISSATKLVISIANASAYARELSNIEAQLNQIAKAECGYNEDEFEAISFIGKDFIQYTMGGSDSECAPPGPGGGFEKDTIVSFSGVKIDMLASGYLNYTDLHMAYDKLFPVELRSGSSYLLCEPEELLIGLSHEGGQLKLHTKNNLGRGYQDSRELDITFTNAPDKFISKPYANFEDESILDGSIDHFISPNGKYVAVLKNLNDENRLYFYAKGNPTPLTRITIPGQVVMEEWCDKNYWKKWNTAIDDANRYIKIQETEDN